MDQPSTSYLSIPPPTSPRRARSPSPNFALSPPNSPTARPLLSRSQSTTRAYQSATKHNGSVSQTPSYSPHLSLVHVAPPSSRRLLIPTVRPSRASPASSPNIPQHRASPSKVARSRAGSLSVATSPDPAINAPPARGPDWIGGGRKFEVVEDQFELEGFVIYAVEKWVVARRRPITVLTVYTGDPQHKITVTALKPQSSLSEPEAQSEWELAIRYLKKDGARPKETDKGVIMVTSLANFPSDFTIVQVPAGNFLEVREQLYTNIDLLRMGCSGRSALTLEEPSETTKDRFISMYHVSDKMASRMGEAFRATVLELIRFVQTALAMFNFFDMCPEERNGLLCDITCEGMRRWVSEIAAPVLGLNVLERAADPNIVAALLSLICIIRNKLHVLGIVVPKDPFVEPQAFMDAIAAFHSHKSHWHSHVHSLSISQSIQSNTSSQPNTISSKEPPGTSTPNPPVVYLNAKLIRLIDQAFDKKTKQSEPYKVHRVLKSKLDDLATDLRSGTGADSDVSGSNVTSASRSVTDIKTFVQIVASGSKDAPQSLRYLWTGRPVMSRKKRREKEVPWSDGEREDRWDKDGGKNGKDRAGNGEKDDVKSTDDEGDAKLWTGRVSRRLEGWAALSRAKKLSVDFGQLGKALLPSDSPTRDDQNGQSGPSILVSKEQDDDEVLSSGQVSPVSDYHPMTGLGSWLNTPQRSAVDVSDYKRRVNEFDQKRPSTKPKYQSRVISWSDPFSARNLIDEEPARSRQISSIARSRLSEDSPVVDDDLDVLHRRRLVTSRSQRRRSFDDAAYIDSSRLLSVERMRIDVELCGQILVMLRREAHLANVAACLEALTARLSRTNTRLREDHEAVRPTLAALMERAAVLQQIEAARSRADALTLETNALQYEVDQFLVEDLWHMALQPRQRILALREKVFGTGRRHPHGVRGARGQFDRIQWTLDGRQRLVDGLGRTESEAEEEDGLDIVHAGLGGLDEEEEEVDVVEHQTLRPTWLLRFFNYWGSRWGQGSRKAHESESQASPMREEEKEHASSTATAPSPLTSLDDSRRRPPVREEFPP